MFSFLIQLLKFDPITFLSIRIDNYQLECESRMIIYFSSSIIYLMVHEDNYKFLENLLHSMFLYGNEM